MDAKCADLWAAFRAWCAETFATTDEMVAAPGVSQFCFETFMDGPKVLQLRGSIVELGPPEGERRSIRKQKSAVPPVET